MKPWSSEYYRGSAESLQRTGKELEVALSVQGARIMDTYVASLNMAADRIDQLEAALRAITSIKDSGPANAGHMRHIAEKALNGEGE